MLLGISGSLRSEATNRKLIREAARHYGGEFVEADLNLPLYSGDMEDLGIPDEVTRLAHRIDEAEAVVISTPEYNQSFSGVLKNALDWVSRVKDVKPWNGKPVVLMSAAAGRSGGARANYALRLAMTSFRPRLLSREVLLADSRNAFDDVGRLFSERYEAQIIDLMDALKKEVALAARA